MRLNLRRLIDSYMILHNTIPRSVEFLPLSNFTNFSQVLVIDGLTGKPINNPLTSSVATFDSPLSISMEGRGNDLFLFWMGDCLFHEGHTDEFATINSAPFDSCNLRFNTREFHKLCITNGDIKGACRSIMETGENMPLAV